LERTSCYGVCFDVIEFAFTRRGEQKISEKRRGSAMEREGGEERRVEEREGKQKREVLRGGEGWRGRAVTEFVSTLSSSRFRVLVGYASDDTPSNLKT
jgi:hypothetical protein